MRLTPLLLTLLLAAPLSAQGRVVKTDGTAVTGAVTAAELDGIAVASGEDTDTVAPDEVLSFRYGPDPDLVQRARAAADRLEYQSAVSLLEEAASLTEPAWLPVYARLLRAETLLAWSAFEATRAGDARDAFEQWLATYPEHFWVARARIGLARALGRAGEVDTAAEQMQELASFAFEQGLGEQVELAARLARCHVYVDGGEPRLARQRLEGSSGLVSSLKDGATDADNPAGLRSHLHARWTEAAILLGDAIESVDGLDGAKRYWEGLLRTERGIGIDARATAQIAVARAARESGDPREAQFALARIAATMNAGPDTMARALYTLGEVCEELDNTPTPGATYYRRVVERFPASPWAAKAREKLGG